MADNDNFSCLGGLTWTNLFSVCVCATGCVWSVLSGAKMGGLEAILTGLGAVLAIFGARKQTFLNLQKQIKMQGVGFRRVQDGAKIGLQNTFVASSNL